MLHCPEWYKNTTLLIKEEKWECITKAENCGCWHCGLVSIERMFITQGKFCNNAQETALYLNDNKKLNWADALMHSPISMETLINMVELGIDVNDTSVAKSFIFHFSPHWKDALEYLFSKGCSVDIQDEDGSNLLMAATRWWRWQEGDNMIRFLLERGADIHLQNKKGVNIISHAKKYFSKED